MLSNAEWKVMNCVWARGLATAREVLDDLAGEIDGAYTTVKTLMARLVEKGALTVTMRGNISVYTPLLTRRRARRAAVRKLMERAFDGAFRPMVHTLLENRKLSKKERATLEHLLEEESR